MTSLRSIMLCSALLAACTQDAPKAANAGGPANAEATPAKPPGSVPSTARPPNDPHAAPAPGDEDEKGPMVPSASGSFDVTLEGKLVHFLRLPVAQNRAVAIPETGVTRLSIGALEGEEGGPGFRILVEGLRPDQIEYPLTIPTPGATAKTNGPYTMTMRYEVHERRVYVLDPDKGATVDLTLESYEGKTLRGRFEGKLAPTAAGLGDPIPVSGKFAVELFLRGVEPGAAANPEGTPAPG
ncbi:hypothetical protein [Paraliomyxa miuraensis]|uniref:hypothetical protein n=1 Tax=Paraliomyxa miuraensis TaxID=376150 RepID=UPI002254D9FF|nr:hypothetical protein [Paraliomyxa miuraensis]MCX4240364.1 hypothetical protein [Paraliomyxa miuraensis]